MTYQKKHSELLGATRAWFSAHGFLEVSTPVLTPYPETSPHLEPFKVEGGGQKFFLATSPEFGMKQILGPELPKIYQISHFFRAGELTPLHLPEFLGVEWYRMGADYEAIIQDCASLVLHLAKAAGTYPKLDWKGVSYDLSTSPKQLYLAETFATETGLEIEEVLEGPNGEEEYFRQMIEFVEPALIKEGLVFLKDYPEHQALLAKASSDKPGYHQRFEMYFAGVELANGWTEETDHAALVKRAESDKKHHADRVFDENYLKSAQEGRLPPCAGVALGLDRLIQVIFGVEQLNQLSVNSVYLLAPE